MSALILTIVGIALTAVLIGGTMYYVGDVLTDGRNRADAGAFISGAQQIAGAVQLHHSMEGTVPADLNALVTAGYLSGVPVVKGSGWAIDTGTRTLTNIVDGEGACEALNDHAGIATPDAVDATALANATYGCITATRTFQFKY